MEHFCIYAIDRRGRGQSGDGNTYAIEREFEDTVAVVDSIGEPANLLGHEFGALCALGAALLTRNLRKLVLYEPTIALPGVLLYPEEVMERLKRLEPLLGSGDREGVANVFWSNAPEFLESKKSSPDWPGWVAATYRQAREAWAETRYTFDAQRFKDMHTPTLLLSHSDSRDTVKAAIEALHTALPNSRVAVMTGREHLTRETEADLLLHEVFAFLIGPR